MKETSRYQAVQSKKLSSPYDPRYVMIDTETGEIVDDAQGYGFRSKQKAYAAFAYKNSKGKKNPKREEAKKWLKENKSFEGLMDQIAFEIAKGSWGPDDKFDTKFVRKLLHDSGFSEEELGFGAYDLLKAWERR